MMKLKTIETDENGNITKFFGFFPSDNVEDEKNYIELNDHSEVVLFVHGKEVVTIDWFNHFLPTRLSARENRIWFWILAICRKYTRAPKIFIDRYYAEEIYKPLANCFLAESPEELRKKRDEDFLDSLGNHE